LCRFNRDSDDSNNTDDGDNDKPVFKASLRVLCMPKNSWTTNGIS